MKREHSESDDVVRPPQKIRRVLKEDRLSRLSDELLVRILGFLSVPTLLTCQLISSKINRLARDSELWKAAYYRRFVLPRAARIPGLKGSNSAHLRYSSRSSRWLEDDHLVRSGSRTDWRKQYRLRHNWARGKCTMSEIIIAERPPDPPLLVMMSNSTIFTADSAAGLRAWSSKSPRTLVATAPLYSRDLENQLIPTSMVLDLSGRDASHERVVLGFEDGSFKIYALHPKKSHFKVLFEHPASSNGALEALAYTSPHLLTMTEHHLLSMYVFTDDSMGDFLEAPKLVYSLQSHTVWPPVALSIRVNADGMTAAIAYALPTYLSGWTVGVQEMRLSLLGELLDSRLATAAENYHAQMFSEPRPTPSPTIRGHFLSSDGMHGSSNDSPSTSKPTSMSYSHPYLLAAHSDNTLSVHMVKSTSSSLSISAGTRLWGHTSSISGAHVGLRGKAVSVSRMGDELRVWDLESSTSSSARRPSKHSDLSIKIQPSKEAVIAYDEKLRAPYFRKESLRFALDQRFDDTTFSQGWVGFDEQNVIVLKEKGEGDQALVVYDFA